MYLSFYSRAWRSGKPPRRTSSFLAHRLTLPASFSRRQCNLITGEGGSGSDDVEILDGMAFLYVCGTIGRCKLQSVEGLWMRGSL